MDHDLFWGLPEPKRWLASVVGSFSGRRFVSVRVPKLIGPINVSSRIADEVRLRCLWAHSVPVEKIESELCPESDIGINRLLAICTGTSINDTDPIDTVMTKLRIGRNDISGLVAIFDVTEVSEAKLIVFYKLLERFIKTCVGLEANFGVIVIACVCPEGKSEKGTCLEIDWSGTLTPIDSYLYIRGRLLDLDRKSLFNDEMVIWIYVEVCRFDLEFADVLIDGYWDGVNSLTKVGGFGSLLNKRRDVLKDYALGGDDNFVLGLIQKWGSAHQPQFVTWFGPISEVEVVIHRAIWRAQIRTIFPRLEEMRAGVIDWANKLNREEFIQRVIQVMRDDVFEDEEEFDAAEIRYLHRARKQFAQVESLLKKMVKIRNSLAHQKVVSISDWRELERLWRDKSNEMKQKARS